MKYFNMFEDIITAENVEILRNLGLNWKYSPSHPETKSDVHTNNNKLWLYFNNKWYCYYTVNLGHLMFDFLHCKNQSDIEGVINKKLIQNDKDYE